MKVAKSTITSLELHYIIKELNDPNSSACLVRGKVNQIYSPSKKELILAIHCPSKGKQLLRIVAGHFLYLTQFKEVSDKHSHPSGFCMFLRKHLRNARIKAIQQLGSERVVEIVFETLAMNSGANNSSKNDNIENNDKIVSKNLVNKSLFCEFFGKGNIVLTDEDRQILGLAERQRWADRTIKAGETYSCPKHRYDYKNVSQGEIKELLKENKDIEIVKVLARELGFGGRYAEKICLMADIDKNTLAQDITTDQINRVLDSIKELVNCPIKSGKSSMNETLDSSFSNIQIEKQKETKSERYEEKLNKIKRIIEQQEKQINEMEKKYKKNQEIGNKIYENYAKIDAMLKQMRMVWKRVPFEEIREKLKKHKIIKGVERDGKIEIEVQK